MRWLPLVALLVGVPMVSGPGCLDPDVGPLQVPFCVDDDSDSSRSVSYAADIEPLFNNDSTGCADCHLPGGQSPIGISIGGLDLTSFSTLSTGGATSSQSIIVPGKPCKSVLYLKLTAAPPSGARMPATGPPFFTASEIQLVHDWIAEGAHDN